MRLFSLSRLVSLHGSFFCKPTLLQRYASPKFMSTTVRSNHIISKYSCAYADVHLVPMFDDNYGFILVDKVTNTSACVDPGDGEIMKSALMELGICLNYILVTHKHSDHVGGVLDLKRAFPLASVVGTKYELVPGLDVPVGEGDSILIGSLPVQVRFPNRVISIHNLTVARI